MPGKKASGRKKPNRPRPQVGRRAAACLRRLPGRYACTPVAAAAAASMHLTPLTPPPASPVFTLRAADRGGAL